MYIGAPSTVMPQVDAGKALVIGALSEERLPSLPDLPTFCEAGIDLIYNSWFGVLAPAKTPELILDKLNADITAMLQKESVQKQLSDLGFIAKVGSREDFIRTIEEETETTRKVIEAAHIEVK
jgi:tripartite-type tricarboxylate transporter receptor subunit TctC